MRKYAYANYYILNRTTTHNVSKVTMYVILY